MSVVSIITQTIVDKNDPAFTNGSIIKPIGLFYIEEESKKLMETKNYVIKKVKHRGEKVLPRVVPSPKPVKIIEINAIKELISSGSVVIANGGGGIAVIENSNGDLEGIDAVIDKDLSTGLLAKSIGASILMILTDIDKVRINFGKPNEVPISNMSLSDAKKYMDNGQFFGWQYGAENRIFNKLP